MKNRLLAKHYFLLVIDVDYLTSKEITHPEYGTIKEQNKTHKGEHLCSQQIVTTLENMCGTCHAPVSFLHQGIQFIDIV